MYGSDIHYFLFGFGFPTFKCRCDSGFLSPTNNDGKEPTGSKAKNNSEAYNFGP